MLCHKLVSYEVVTLKNLCTIINALTIYILLFVISVVIINLILSMKQLTHVVF